MSAGGAANGIRLYRLYSSAQHPEEADTSYVGEHDFRGFRDHEALAG